jgi:hypothetical protein
VRALSVALCAIVLCGCSSLPNGRAWGEDATLRPGWSEVRDSAIQAARDPWVWAPLVGAAAFQIDDWDRRTSDWARERTPVFGSQSSAEEWSDDLRTASSVAHYATILATPGGEDADRWLLSKAKGTLVGAGAVAATGGLTNMLKSASDRERPNALGSKSFPSGHTSSSAVHTRLASRNLEAITMSSKQRAALDVGLTALTIGTSWARIEAGWHYPSDTLFSLALGNFLASFVNDAFLGLDPAPASVTFVPTPSGAMLQWSWTLSGR